MTSMTYTTGNTGFMDCAAYPANGPCSSWLHTTS